MPRDLFADETISNGSQPPRDLFAEQSAPAAKLLQGGKEGSFWQSAGNSIAGLVRGAGSIGATLLSPIDSGARALNGGQPVSVGGYDIVGQDRRAGMDAGLTEMGAEPDSLLFKAGKLASEIAGTAGAGGAAANVLAKVAPGVAAAAPGLLQSLRTGGMSANGATGMTGAGIRAAGGAGGGLLSAGAIDPHDALTGAGVGAVFPGVVQLAGKAGGSVFNALKGGVANSGRMLADGMGVTTSELPELIAKLNSAPESLVNGSKLTVAQALSLQGSKLPGASLLERVVAEGPGGNGLLTRYADQQAARMIALANNGAETYQGASADIKDRAGSKIAAMLRTQYGDDSATAKALWEKTYGQALNDNVALRLPLDKMDAAMDPLGRGTVKAGKDAKAFINEANSIGTMQLPGIKAASEGAQPLTLLQAVRKAGGISIINNDGLSGELAGLRGDVKNIVRRNGGLTPGQMAERMRESGYIGDEDASTLLNALRNDATGLPSYSSNADRVGHFQSNADAAYGGVPTSESVPIAVPFAEFQRLRRSAGSMAARLGSHPGNETEAGVLGKFSDLMTQRADDAANGTGMMGDNITPEFLGLYNQSRAATKQNADLYKGGSNIAQILRKTVGQDYTIGSDEVMNKLWHGGAGLSDDVSRLKSTLSANNYGPGLDELRRFVMTDAAGKTTASGALGAALPKYVENRLPALQEAMSPDQLNSLTSVAHDIRNAEFAANVSGMRGSDSMAKISRAMDAGLLDSPITKLVTQLPGIRQFGGNAAREKLASMVVDSKAQQLSKLLADPKLAVNALKNSAFVKTLNPAVYQQLVRASQVAPALASQMLPE